jgi:hypothetical protein
MCSRLEFHCSNVLTILQILYMVRVWHEITKWGRQTSYRAQQMAENRRHQCGTTYQQMLQLLFSTLNARWQVHAVYVSLQTTCNLLRLFRFRINPVGRGLCDELIARPQESYRVSVCVWSRNPEKGGRRSILDYKCLWMKKNAFVA